MSEQQPHHGPKPKTVGRWLLSCGFLQFLLGIFFCPETNPPSPCWPYFPIFVITAVLGAIFVATTSRTSPSVAKFGRLHACMLAGFLLMVMGPCGYEATDAADNARTAARYRRVTYILLPIGAGIAACSAIGIFLLDRQRP